MILKLKMLNDYLDKNMFYYLHIIIVTSGYCQLIFNEEEVTLDACAANKSQLFKMINLKFLVLAS